MVILSLTDSKSLRPNWNFVPWMTLCRFLMHWSLCFLGVHCWWGFFINYFKIGEEKSLSAASATLQRAVTGRAKAENSLNFFWNVHRFMLCFPPPCSHMRILAKLWIKRCTLKFTTYMFTHRNVAKQFSITKGIRTLEVAFKLSSLLYKCLDSCFKICFTFSCIL